MMEVSERIAVSVIVVYTDTQKLEEARTWTQKQSLWGTMEWIALDNRRNRFSSAAKALNYGAEMAKGDILVFMHQDVYLWDLNAMDAYRLYLEIHPNSIIGPAGKREDGNVVMDLYETKDKIQRGERANGQIYEVATLDECLIAMTRNTWERLRFDEICCDNWHGYAMDICMANKLAGYRNVMVPLKICHDSLGNPENNGFRRTVGNLVKKYRKTGIKQISGCCIELNCNLRSYYWYRIKALIKDVLKKMGLR